MREIEFRAKTRPQLLGVIDSIPQYTNSEWVYGYYAPTYLFEKDGEIKNTYCIISDKFIGEQEMMGCGVNSGLPMIYNIMQDTLGQYAGLKDKNGKKIFEGDIVEVEFLNSSPTRLSVVAKNEKFIYKIIFKNGCFGLQSKIDRFTSFDGVCNTEFEVIGNVYDNLEILKGEEV